MASEAVEITPLEKRAGEPSVAAKHGGLQKDVEVGAEMVDIDRIEKVYA
jgi:predicted RecB family endonuclease